MVKLKLQTSLKIDCFKVLNSHYCGKLKYV